MDQTVGTVLGTLVRAANPLYRLPAFVTLLRTRARVAKLNPRPCQPGDLSGPLSGKLLVALEYTLKRATQAALSINESFTCDGSHQFNLVDDSNRHLIDFLAVLDLTDLLLKWVKEASCWVAAVGLGQSELNTSSYEKVQAEAVEVCSKLGVVVPTFGCLGFGKIRDACRFIKAGAKMPKLKNKIRHLANNVQYIKRGMPCMLPHLVEATMKGHMEAMCSPHERIDEPKLGEIEVCVRQLAKEVFSGVIFHPEECMPSLSACYDVSRVDGGPAAQLSAGFFASPQFRQIPEVTLQGLLWSQELLLMREVAPGQVEAVYSRAIDRVLLEQFADYVDEETEVRLERPAPASPAPVLEPCKCRIVSMGDAVLYHRCIQLQKLMHHRMRKLPTFQWIGKPIDETAWSDTYDEPLYYRKEGWIYVSGDYKASTDNLDPLLSEAAFEGVCGSVRLWDGRRMDETAWRVLGLNCLTRHLMDYRSSIDVEPALEHTLVKPQAWGQLMGSPVSFPILNLCNAAATAVGLGWTPAEGPVLAFLERYRVRTNGDDIAFRCPPALYKRWQHAVSSAGLAPSLGKNFTMDDAVIINSEFRELVEAYGPLLPGDELPLVWRYWSSLDLPVLFGMEAKGPLAGKCFLDHLLWWSMEALARTVTRGVDPDVAARRMDRFVFYYDSVIKRLPAGVNAYVPLGLGGAGLPDPLRVACVPEGNRLRAGYLACLDPETRVQALSPPCQEGGTVWETLLKQALQSQYLSEKYHEVVDDPMAPTYDTWGFANRPGAQVWASVLTQLFKDKFLFLAATRGAHIRTNPFLFVQASKELYEEVRFGVVKGLSLESLKDFDFVYDDLSEPNWLDSRRSILREVRQSMSLDPFDVDWSDWIDLKGAKGAFQEMTYFRTRKTNKGLNWVTCSRRNARELECSLNGEVQLGAVGSRLYLELRMANRVLGQCRHARDSGLSPMENSSLSTWDRVVRRDRTELSRASRTVIRLDGGRGNEPGVAL